MSYVLSIYSVAAYKEVLLPAIDDSDYVLEIDKGLYGFESDYAINMEIMQGEWRFVDAAEYTIFNPGIGKNYEGDALKNEDMFSVLFEGNSQIFIVVKQINSSFFVYSKYTLEGMNNITIGTIPECILQYNRMVNNHNLISHSHASIVRQGNGFVLVDSSSNGTFLNEKRVPRGNIALQYGDLINIYGLKIIFLESFLAINTSVGGLRIRPNSLNPYIPFERDESEYAQMEVAKDELFHRSPRNIPKIETEEVEIEAAPQAKDPNQSPSMAAIGPAMTMALPMLLSSTLSISGNLMAGRQMNVLMFTGIITAVGSSAVGTFWSIKNMNTQKKKNRQEELRRFEMYSEYLIRCSNEIKEKYEHNTQALNQMYHPALECASINRNNIELWNRNTRHEDFLKHRLGIGQIPFQAEIKVPKERFSMINDTLNDRPRMIKESYKMLNDVPVCVDLFANKLIGLIGGEHYRGCYQVMHNLVAQIASSDCYTDVKMAFVYDGSENGSEWTFARWLPHTWSTDGKVRYLATDRGTASDIFYEITNVLRFRAEESKENHTGNKNSLQIPYYILFLENPEWLEGELLSKYVYNKDENYGITTVLLAQRYDELPNSCEFIIENTPHYTGAYYVTDGLDDRISIKYDQLGANVLEQMGRRLCGVKVKEETSGGEIPNSLTFFDMYGISKLEEFHVMDRWRKNRTYETLRALVGQKAGGADCYLDVHEKYHGPHGLVAGTTGSGKSETLQTYMLSLALNYSPDDVGFFIIDYKGGGMANLFNGLPHILGQISNLSGNQVRRAMVSIKSENMRRQRIFNEHGVNNINLYTRLYKNNEANIPIPHLFIIIDEFAELKREEPEFMRELISVAQVGRSLGVHLILATQKPAGTVDDNIWSNSKFRLCLRVQDRQDSMDMLHKPDAAYITQAGRCYMQVGNDELYELFQSGWSGATYSEDGVIQTDIARMLGDNGKAALVGSHAQLMQKEKIKNAWFKKLIEIADAAAAKTGATIEEIDRNKDLSGAFAHNFFVSAERMDVEYPESDYNTRRVLDFLSVYAECLKQGNTDKESLPGQVNTLSAMLHKKMPEEKEKTQLDAVVEYLAEVAKENNYTHNLRLWLPVLPEELYLTDLDGYNTNLYDGKTWQEAGKHFTLDTMIGLYDDPENQAQNPLVIDLADSGNFAVIGTAMSGKSTFMLSFAYALANKYSPEAVNFYILDFSSKMLGSISKMPHVGDVMFEDDLEKVDKFFTFLNRILQERKDLLQGGNYSQYVRANGRKIPAIVVMIDNYGSFRTKTENRFDDMLLSLMKEANAYGIYFVYSAGGFSTSEIPGRMAELFKNAVSLEMTDRYAYSEVLRVMHLDVFPEEGVKGRGLAKVGESVLEFQTALSVQAEDDFTRGEKLREISEQMAAAWTGKCARKIPTIPEEPVWNEFAELDDTKYLSQSGNYIPFGYDQRTAAVYGINLRNTYTYLLSGKARMGKTNALKVLALSAKLSGGKIVIFDLNGELQRFAQTVDAQYVDSEEKIFNFFKELIPEFQARNKVKKQAMEQGLTDKELYQKMQQFPKLFFFIGDLVQFCKAVKNPAEGIGKMAPTVCNLLDKGAMHNVFWFGCFNPDQSTDVLGNEVFNVFIRDKVGIHFGGNVQNQKIMSYEYMKYTEQSKKYPAGVGVLPSHEEDDTKVVVVPFYRA